MSTVIIVLLAIIGINFAILVAATLVDWMVEKLILNSNTASTNFEETQ